MEKAIPATGFSQRRESFSFFGQTLNWLFSQRHFHIKLLSGTVAGVVVIVFLAGVFLLVTYRNHIQEALRTHTIGVMRLSSVVEKDIAALETGHRGFLLTGNPSYRDAFEQRREEIKRRIDDLAALILNSAAQRKRVIKVQELVQTWAITVAEPQMNARPTKGASTNAGLTLGNSLLDQARDILQSLQNEEQIILNQRIRDQEWAAQYTQILDLLPKLERSVVEMEKEKRGLLLTGDTAFFEGYKRAAASFVSYHGYLSILIANDPDQASLLTAIRENVEKWVASFAGPETEGKRSGREFASQSNDNADRLLADARQKISLFERNELSTYEERVATATKQRIFKTSALAALCLFAVALLVVSNSYSCVLVRRQLSKLSGVETRIKSIIENILDGMIIVDGHGVICSMNPAAAKMFGCVNDEMVGHNFIKLVPKCYGPTPEAPATACAWTDLASRTGSVALAVGKTRRAASFPIEISLSEMTVDHEQFYVAMIRDVTERKRFETEIAAEKESLAVTLRSIGDGVITTDVKGKIIMINNAGEHLTGWESKEAIGQPLKTVFNVTIDLAAQARAQNNNGYRNEAQSILVTLPENATLVSRDGTQHVVEQVASPIRDNKNQVVGVVLVFRDITERQRTETERRKAETLEQLGLLAGGIAHDFNNLLTAIIGNISLASLLLKPDDEMGTRLNDAKNASLRARDLAQQLLTFARGGAPIKQTASIGKLIQDTVSFSLRGSHSRADFNFGPDLWPAEIDCGQISQVVQNLVVNADQAMPDGGTLSVSCENFVHTPETQPQVTDLQCGDYIRITIRDQGTGIPENYLKRIFDPYFTTKAKGNGLGLATTYSIMKNHNGLITVESQVHVGSTFTLYLPASRHQVMSAELEVPTMPMASVGPEGGRILIVDDEEAIRALVVFTLERLGYEVAEAETALDGVNLYREKFEEGRRFDAVILDLTLPGGMGGKEALKRLMEIDPTVNAIVSSGYAMDATMSRYQDYGFRGVIAKPYEAAELGKIVHEVIQASRVNLVEDFDGGRLASRVA